jgi:hypothetical protein
MIQKVLGSLSLIAISSIAFANSCPTQLHREYDGHWVSKQSPGWKSAEITPAGVTINTKDFGGAVYSPKQKRIACVYRSSKGFWVAMISHTHKGFQVNKHALDDARTATAWQWDHNHKDFNCGRPTVTKGKNCQFSLHS